MPRPGTLLTNVDDYYHVVWRNDFPKIVITKGEHDKPEGQIVLSTWEVNKAQDLWYLLDRIYPCMGSFERFKANYGEDPNDIFKVILPYTLNRT